MPFSLTMKIIDTKYLVPSNKRCVDPDAYDAADSLCVEQWCGKLKKMSHDNTKKNVKAHQEGNCDGLQKKKNQFGQA